MSARGAAFSRSKLASEPPESKVVTAVHGQSPLERSHQCSARLFGRNKISDGKRNADGGGVLFHVWVLGESDVSSIESGLGAAAFFENKPVVERSEVVIVSVKPDVVGKALSEVKGLAACSKKLFISVAMGVNIATIEKNLPLDARVIRVMPNTPALVRQGAAVLSRGSRATSEDAELTARLFRAVGSCDEVPEYQMDAVTALSGSGPAYVYMMIESLADGGIRCGLPRDLALKLAAQTALGSAAMIREGSHPAQLRDNVTSPAGSTAEGTYHLEQNGFRAAVIGAVSAATERCKIVSKEIN
ncbi:Pyrroline-5-carboxylate reductase [Eumeta japonica]|uniref:pyrroline-5-carboxylate reductase n=1 Tax=Eumeta variegata TaxID=151549 RepID=A0A4C1TDH4_EUMVA|nr:Pyrroline-5-carboxylate reductase [Eumeta japonica]